MSQAPRLPEDMDLPEPEVRQRRHFSLVWIIPLVAALAGAWMAYDAISSQGPVVVISFDSAEGLTPGKTKIKYKDVDVGQVESMEFTPDLSRVLVKARLSKGVERYLRDKTQFWVVRARVTASEVTGLATLFSGAYIGMQPSKEGKVVREFTGLDKPPAVTEKLPGRHFFLRAERLGSLEAGSPVYFRQIKVGQVVSYELAEGGDAVLIKVFVAAPHHERVRQNTRFWLVSGVGVNVDARGVRVNSESLLSMLLGGLAFETPPGLEQNSAAPEGASYTLYPSREASYEKSFDYKEYYLLHFPGTVRGLAVGAPVEFRGVRVGQVADLRLQFDQERLDARIPVLIEVEPERFERRGKAAKSPSKIMDRMVAKGLRAQLKLGSLITGQVFVDLDFHPRESPAQVLHGGDYPELPTLASPLEGILGSVARIVAKLDAWPLAELGEEVRGTVAEARRAMEQARALMRDLDQKSLPQAGAVMDQAQKTLARVEDALHPDYGLQTDVQKMLQELTDAVQSLRVLADYLERHPDALILGKDKEPK